MRCETPIFGNPSNMSTIFQKFIEKNMSNWANIFTNFFVKLSRKIIWKENTFNILNF